VSRQELKKRGRSYYRRLGFLALSISILVPIIGPHIFSLSCDDFPPLMFKLASAQTASTTFLTYQSPVYRISMQYPSDWHKQEGQGKEGGLSEVVSFYSPSKSAFIKLIQINSTEVMNATLSQLLTEATIRDIHIVKDFQLIEASTSGILAGRFAYILVSTGEILKGVRYQTQEVGTLIGNTEYIVVYEALVSDYSKYFPLASRLIDSFKQLE
jgi:PsbP-like protein